MPFPLGGWQGAPALRCVIDNPAELGLDLIDQMRASSGPGVRLVWLVTDLWGQEIWERFLIKLVNDRTFGGLPITTIRESIQTRWSNIGIDWVVDISQTFGKPMNADALRETAVRSSAVPVPSELVWFDPPSENVTIDAMEIIHDCFSPTVGSWIYHGGKDQLQQQAFRCAGRSAATWGVRDRSEGTWTET